MMSRQDDDLEEEGDVLGTPGSEKKCWGETAVPETPTVANHTKRTKGNAGGGGVTLTLRDQEKVCIHLPPKEKNLIIPKQHIDSLKKENFSIKLRVHFLEERLAKLAPEQIDAGRPKSNLASLEHPATRNSIAHSQHVK
jgi:Centrosomin N-terminal motif 1